MQTQHHAPPAWEDFLDSEPDYGFLWETFPSRDRAAFLDEYPTIRLSWTAYEGKRGGKGWKNTENQRVVYGSKKPGERQPAVDKATRQATGRAHAEEIAKRFTAKEHEALSRVLAKVQESAAIRGGELGATGLRALTMALGLKNIGRLSKAELVDAVLEHVGRQDLAKSQSEAEAKGGKPAHQRGGVQNVPVRDLHVDPERFQYKLNVDKSGVTGELKGVEKFNPDFAGVVTVWHDPGDGKDYVINGHHRYELAKRTGHGELAVRYVDEPDAKKARARGALINIAEGRGTAIDAAKFLRDTGFTIQEMSKEGISLRGAVARDAATFTALNDHAFDRVARGTLDPAKALAVAKHLPDHDLQAQLFRLLDKREEEGKDLSPRTIEEMAKEMAATPKTTKTEDSLFGPIDSEESLFVPRNELKSHIRGELSREVNDFLAVASKKRAERVGKAGNVLDPEANKKVAEEADRVRNVFDTLVNRKGPISDAVNQGAAAYAQAKSKKDREAARDKTLASVREAVFKEAGVGGEKPAAAEPKPADHADLAAIPQGDMGRVNGFMVRRTGPDEFRIEKEGGRGVVKGDAKTVQEHMGRELKAQRAYGKQLPEAIKRAEAFTEPAFLDQAGQRRAEDGFRKLPVGAPVVSLDPATHGRAGRIVRDSDGRNRVKLDGEDGFAGSNIEPLDPKLSWRVRPEDLPPEEPRPEQKAMFSIGSGRR